MPGLPWCLLQSMERPNANRCRVSLAVVLLVVGATGHPAWGQSKPQSPDVPPQANKVQSMSEAKADCQALLNSVLPFAKQMLSQHGAFYPYGGAMRPDGQVIAVGGYNGVEHPAPSEILTLLKGAFTTGARQGEYKATALVVDSRFTFSATGEKTDAISVSLDHRAGYSVTVIFPYKLENKQLVVAAPIAQHGKADIFPGQ